jgi:membrane protein implicated in regulation of membrane protease activity
VRRKRAFADQKWAQRDFTAVAVFVVLVFLGGRWPVCFVLALAYVLLFATVALVRYLRRRSRWAREEPKEFWADKLK